MIIDRSGKWVSSQMTAIDAQHREMRGDQIEEICRFFGVLPIMLGHSSGGKANTYASAEQMFLAHQLHTLAPRWQMYEQSMDAYLLTDAERAEGYYWDFVEEGMIRGLVTDTKDVLLGYVNGGILTPNEARAKLDLNPDDDPESDELRIPVNVSQAPVDPSPDPNSETPPNPDGN
jgi:HK97 family phage portal protein